MLNICISTLFFFYLHKFECYCIFYNNNCIAISNKKSCKLTSKPLSGSHPICPTCLKNKRCLQKCHVGNKFFLINFYNIQPKHLAVIFDTKFIRMQAYKYNYLYACILINFIFKLYVLQ